MEFIRVNDSNEQEYGSYITKKAIFFAFSKKKRYNGVNCFRIIGG